MNSKRDIYGAFFVACAFMLLQACAGTIGAYKTAETLEQHVYVMAEHYDILLEQVAMYVEREDASPTAKAKLQDVVRKGEPIFQKLELARAVYEGNVTAENEAALASVLNEALFQLNRVVEALRGAK